jgi:hypothetical protein
MLIQYLLQLLVESIPFGEQLIELNLARARS